MKKFELPEKAKRRNEFRELGFAAVLLLLMLVTLI